MTHLGDEVSRDHDVSVRGVVLHVVRVGGVDAAQHLPGEHQLRCLGAVLCARPRGAPHLFFSLCVDRHNEGYQDTGRVSCSYWYFLSNAEGLNGVLILELQLHGTPEAKNSAVPAAKDDFLGVILSIAFIFVKKNKKRTTL